jgi:hypothetical protein
MSSFFISCCYKSCRYFNSSLCSVTSSSLRYPRRSNHLAETAYSFSRRRYASLMRNDWRYFVRRCSRISRHLHNPIRRNESRCISSMVTSYYERISLLMVTSSRSCAAITELQKSVFWEAVLTSAFALGISMCFLWFFPSSPFSHVDAMSSFRSSQQLLLCEPAHPDSPLLDTETNGDRKSRVFSAMSMLSSMPPRQDHKCYDSGNTKRSDGEMALREPHSIPEHLMKPHISSLHSIPVAESTKPYDVSALNKNGLEDCAFAVSRQHINDCSTSLSSCFRYQYVL